MNPVTMLELHGQPNSQHRIFSDATFQPLTWMDGYKSSQFKQYPDDMQGLWSYGEARSGAKHAKIPFLGLQPFLKEFLTRPITHAHVDFQKKFNSKFGAPFNEAGYRRIVDEFGGHWPVEILALPEGTVFGPGVPPFYIHETHPDFAWVVSPLETALLRAVWYPCTVGAVGISLWGTLYSYLVRYTDLTEEEIQAHIPFAMNDFGARGVECHEAAMLGGLAFLATGFRGTDNAEAVHGATLYYHHPIGEAGSTIPASEHSTATAFGLEPEQEIEFNNHMIKAFGDGPIFASVIDSVDPERNVREHWLKANLEAVRDMKANLVLRPDSGIPEQEAVKTLHWIAEVIGCSVNSKGLLVLGTKVRVIYGDGINEESLWSVLEAIVSAGFSPENIVFGMGGALLQAVNRDTDRWAMKACQINRGGTWQPIGKKPKTDPTKASKFGVWAVYEEDGVIKTAPESDKPSALRPRFRNGLLLEDYSLDMVRENVNRNATR